MVGKGAFTAKQSPSASVSRRRLLMIATAGIAGGTVAGGIIGVVVGVRPLESAPWQLDPVPARLLPDVLTTLSPDQAGQLGEKARRCREPLAMVAVRHSPGMPGGTVRILSRGYQSPPFVLTAAPGLIAFPYPAAYSNGRGVLTLVGDASDIIVALRPQYLSHELKGTALVNVWWTPVQGCP